MHFHVCMYVYVLNVFWDQNVDFFNITKRYANLNYYCTHGYAVEEGCTRWIFTCPCETHKYYTLRDSSLGRKSQKEVQDTLPLTTKFLLGPTSSIYNCAYHSSASYIYNVYTFPKLISMHYFSIPSRIFCNKIIPYTLQTSHIPEYM